LARMLFRVGDGFRDFLADPAERLLVKHATDLEVLAVVNERLAKYGKRLVPVPAADPLAGISDAEIARQARGLGGGYDN
jgi:hypothetical protein